MRMHRLALFVAPAALLALATPAGANHSWGGYHWARTSNPFTVQVGDNVDSRWDSYLDTTVADWSQSSVLDLAKVPGSTSPRKCRAVSGRIQVCNASYGRNGWLGLASISISGGTHITAGTTKLNDSYFDTAQYNTPAWRNLVTCQEVGHDLGLDHQDENNSNANLGTCMDYTNLPATNQHPNAHDYQQLEAIYAHLDSSSTVLAAGEATQALSALDHSASSWGREVAGSRASGHSVFARDFADGTLVVTHVTWAE